MGLDAKKATPPMSSTPATMHTAVPMAMPTEPRRGLTWGESELPANWLARKARVTLRTSMMATPETTCSHAQSR